MHTGIVQTVLNNFRQARSEEITIRGYSFSKATEGGSILKAFHLRLVQIVYLCKICGSGEIVILVLPLHRF